jgi:hypothetical protein
MKSSHIERARRYLSKMPIAISGQGGRKVTFLAACHAAIGFDLNEDEAIIAMSDWNAACLPPWSERDLRQKIASARRDCKHNPGYLLREDERDSALSSSPAPKAANGSPESKRRRWPAFSSLKADEMEVIASIRRLDASQFTRYAVRQAHQQGYISRAHILGHACFVLHDGNFAQARRFDGQPFTLPDGRTVKAWNLPGSQGQFVGHGAGWLGGPEVRILLVEGAIALVEALAAHNHVGPNSGWTIVAATSAYSRFEKDPAIQQALAGRRVRIVPDNEPDGAGYQAAATWLAELEALGCSVEVRALPEGIKDLGPLIADPVLHHKTLHALFQ